MIRNGIEYFKTEWIDIINHNGIDYIRKECIMYTDFHTISWNTYPDDHRIGGPLEYYSKPMGWGDDNGMLNNGAPVPELETIFQTEIRQSQ